MFASGGSVKAMTSAQTVSIGAIEYNHGGYHWVPAGAAVAAEAVGAEGVAAFLGGPVVAGFLGITAVGTTIYNNTSAEDVAIITNAISDGVSKIGSGFVSMGSTMQNMEIESNSLMGGSPTSLMMPAKASVQTGSVLYNSKEDTAVSKGKASGGGGGDNGKPGPGGNGLGPASAGGGAVVLEKARQNVVKGSVWNGGSRAKADKDPRPSYVDKQAKGQKAEAAGQQPLERMDYDIHPSKLPGGRGIDTVASKSNVKGEPIDIIAVESKFRTSGTPKLDKQMSDDWISGNIERMKKSTDPKVRETGYLLDTNRHLIRRKANLMDPSGANRWNQIKLPPTKIFKE